MSNQELVREIQARMSKSASQATIAEVLKVAKEMAIEALTEGDRHVCITGIGSLKAVKREAKIGYDIHRKKKVKIPAKYTLKFTCAQVLRDSLNV